MASADTGQLQFGKFDPERRDAGRTAQQPYLHQPPQRRREHAVARLLYLAKASEYINKKEKQLGDGRQPQIPGHRVAMLHPRQFGCARLQIKGHQRQGRNGKRRQVQQRLAPQGLLEQQRAQIEIEEWTDQQAQRRHRVGAVRQDGIQVPQAQPCMKNDAGTGEQHGRQQPVGRA
jgi:hypothetical protein